jgi:hypothetical protein
VLQAPGSLQKGDMWRGPPAVQPAGPPTATSAIKASRLTGGGPVQTG